MKIRDFLILGLIWHLEGFGSIENTPTGCGSDLDPNRFFVFVYQPKLRPGKVLEFAEGHGIQGP